MIREQFWRGNAVLTQIVAPYLQLPEPEAVTQYLRLNDPYRAELGKWLDEMTTELEAEFGLATAARRLGGIPFDLPAGFFDKFAGDGIDPTRITSAAHALVYLRGLGGRSDAHAKRGQLVGILLDRLEGQVELFAAFLWKGARQLYRSASWRRLHSSIAFGLLWVWADRLTASIASCAVDTEKVAEMIRRSEPADLTHAFRQDGIPGWFRDYAFRIDDEVVFGAMVAAALQVAPLSELPEGLRARILTTIGNVGETSWFPKIPIMFPRRSVPGLWISNDPVNAVVQSGTTTIPAFAARDPDDHVRALLAESINPERPFLVTGLLSVADLSTVTKETARNLVVYIDKLHADFAHHSVDVSYRHAACIRAECLGLMDDQQQMQAMMSQLALSFAAAHGHRKIVYALDPELSPAMKDLVHLLEMTIAFARHTPGSAKAQVAALASQVEAIPAHWPDARCGCIEFLDRTVAMLPALQAAEAWPALLRLRET